MVKQSNFSCLFINLSPEVKTLFKYATFLYTFYYNWVLTACLSSIFLLLSHIYIYIYIYTHSWNDTISNKIDGKKQVYYSWSLRKLVIAGWNSLENLLWGIF